MPKSSAQFLFLGTMLAAAGYGATFLLSAYFRANGGSDLDTGTTLGAAMIGTFVGVPLVGWFSGRFDAARMSAIAACAVGCGFLLLAVSAGGTLAMSLASGFLIGLGWGMFYVGAPMSLSERVTDRDRGFWFTRFGAFQMAGIGGGPLVLNLAVDQAGLSIAATFQLVGIACLVAGLSLWMFSTIAPGARRSSSRARPCAFSTGSPWAGPGPASGCRIRPRPRSCLSC